MSAAIELSRVSKRFSDGGGTLEVLREADLVVEQGELTAIVGPSGSGKSTLLYIAGGLDRRFEGAVRVNGTDLKTLPDGALAQFRAREVGFVFQSFNLLSNLTALENVLLPGFFGARPEGALDQARRALDEVGLLAKAHRRPAALSGGERQRVALARALFLKPSILLADEPTGNLDASTGREIIGLFTRLNREHRMTLVIVTHEDRVSAAASRVLRLSAGRLVPEA